MSISKVEGIDKTIKKIWKYNDGVRENLKKVTKDSSRRVVKVASSRVRVGKTGNLKKSIRAKYFWKEGPASTIFPRGRKGAARHLVERGTKERFHKSGKRVGRMIAKPFMKPAADSEKGKYESNVKKVINKDVTI